MNIKNDEISQSDMRLANKISDDILDKFLNLENLYRAHQGRKLSKIRWNENCNCFEFEIRVNHTMFKSYNFGMDEILEIKNSTGDQSQKFRVIGLKRISTFPESDTLVTLIPAIR